MFYGYTIFLLHFSIVLVGSGSSQFFIRIQIQGNDTDPDPPQWLAPFSSFSLSYHCLRCALLEIQRPRNVRSLYFGFLLEGVHQLGEHFLKRFLYWFFILHVTVITVWELRLAVLVLAGARTQVPPGPGWSLDNTGLRSWLKCGPGFIEPSWLRPLCHKPSHNSCLPSSLDY